MATSEFTPFGLESGAYVYDPATWEADPTRESGFPPGLVPKEGLNTPIRQSSSITTMIANFIAARQASNVLDDGDLVTLLAQYENAVKNIIQQNATSYRLGSATGSATSRVVNLIPGTWQLILQVSSSFADGSNYDITLTQGASIVGSLNSLSISASGRQYRVGGAGFGRVTGITSYAMNTLVVNQAQSGNFTMAIAAVSAGGLTCRGSILTLEKIA